MSLNAKRLWGVTLLGLAGILAVYFVAGPARFWLNWVLWFVFLLTLALGSLFMVALEHLVSSRWSVPIRRIPERLSTLLLPLVPVGMIALGAVPVLYPGARPEALANKLLAGKAFWLGLPFFSLRVALCFLAWLLALSVLVRGSLRQDESRDPQFNVRARRFAPLAMVFFGLGITVVAFDWISGLEPEWYSDIFGIYLFAGAFLSALSGTLLMVLHLQGRGRLPEVRRDHLYNLGGFIFAFTVFWSYIGFAQYMLMWYADLPEEVVWYQKRTQGGWLAVVILMGLLHFVIPFFALLTRDAKQAGRRLHWVAWSMLAAHLLDLYWLIFPVLMPNPVLSWPELSFALFFLGGAFLWVHRVRELGADLPVGDAFLKQGLEFRL
ncbi:hypothetical protein [Holophaga foetida]|uniref:hypothetical protein n=1 Tax=Holophaga foetida TaxID=35839 RepID=UPI0002472EF7|nr:hypothetical protein [Holophaga foetida]